MIIAEQDKLDLLSSFGYTEREQVFLYLVAKHSGCFTLSQFCSCAGIRSGAASARFIQKASGWRHAGMASLRCGSRPAIYRLSERLHELLGRGVGTYPRRDSALRTRLLCLDFVIANPDYSFLHTEAEKIAFFSGRGPVRRFVGVRADGGTVEHSFPDNFPIYVAGGRVSFVAIDLGLSSLRRFTRAHRGLLLSQPSRLVLVCGHAAGASSARATFETALNGVEVSDELVASFIERRDLERIPVKDLEPWQAGRLRDLRLIRFAHRFDAWNVPAEGADCEFTAWTAPVNYDFLRGDGREVPVGALQFSSQPSCHPVGIGEV